MSSITVPVNSHRHPRVLACVLCQHRKIKCDRNTPCSNCLKANVACTPSTPAPARKRRRPNQDLQERLARCEQLLKQYAGGTAPGQQDPHDPSLPMASPPTTSSSIGQVEIALSPSVYEPLEKSTPGKMITDTSGSRFIDSHLWTTFYDELQAMRNIVDTEDPEDSSVLGDGLTPDNHADLLFPSDASSPNVEEYQLDPANAFRLWQIFLDRVNPLTKLVHIPTLQPYLMEAAGDVTSVPANYQALLFAVFLMATVSLSEEECLQLTGKSRDSVLRRLTNGTKHSLIRFDFMRNYDMAALQALTLFLIALQGRYDRHATWVFSGIVVRIAQKMGYHRDGETLKLTPFETEMRRRIWWQILALDTKIAMISGLSHNSIQGKTDTKLPQNLNDADLFPGSTEPVVSREGPTEMAFVLIGNQLSKFMVQEASRSGFESAVMGLSSEDDAEQAASHAVMEKYRNLIRELNMALQDIEIRYIDPSAGKAHKAALWMRPMLTTKLNEMLVPMREQPEWGTEIFGSKDNLFKIILMNNENNVEAFDRMVEHGFAWFVRLYFQIDVFAVLTGQLVQHPIGSLSDRGWATVQKIYQYVPEMYDVSSKTYAAQAQLVVKSWRARERAFCKAGLPLEEPLCIMKLRESLPGQDSRSSTQSGLTPPAAINSQPPARDLDQFLGGHLDFNALDWDMWGEMNTNSIGNNNIPPAMFGNFGLGNLG